MITSEELMAALGVVNTATLILVGFTWKKVDKLSNGCFTRHMKIAEDSAIVKMKADALHERIDRMDNYVRD